jgi:biopolymer transport protein ExbD
MNLKLESRNVRIELIPLIDIIFLLLVFFIYSMLSMVVYRGIPVQLPEADSVETETEQHLVITIDAGGGIYVDRESVFPQDLLSILSDAHEVSPNKSVIISGHGRADYQVFVDVLDKVRLAGFKSVSMEARPREEGL